MATGADISTQELWARLFKAPTVGSYLANSNEVILPSFSDYLVQVAEERGMRRDQVIANAGLERTFGYRLFSGTRNPSRDTVLQLSFGLRLDCDETQQLLKVAQKSPLHPKVKRDAVVAWCLHHAYPLMATQQALYDHGLPPLGGTRRAR